MGELPRLEGFQGDRRSVKRERRLSQERVYREGEDDRKEEDTAKAFCKKYYNFFIFSSYFRHSHIKTIALF